MMPMMFASLIRREVSATSRRHMPGVISAIFSHADTALPPRDIYAAFSPITDYFSYSVARDVTTKMSLLPTGAREIRRMLESHCRRYAAGCASSYYDFDFAMPMPPLLLLPCFATIDAVDYCRWQATLR